MLRTQCGEGSRSRSDAEASYLRRHHGPVDQMLLSAEMADANACLQLTLGNMSTDTSVTQPHYSSCLNVLQSITRHHMRSRQAWRNENLCQLSVGQEWPIFSENGQTQRSRSWLGLCRSRKTEWQYVSIGHNNFDTAYVHNNDHKSPWNWDQQLLQTGGIQR